MTKSIIGWILSKLFPIRDAGVLNENATYYGKRLNWDAIKAKEYEIFYGGQDGTTRRYE